MSVRQMTRELGLYLFLLVGGFTILFGIAVASAYFEAMAYESVTGKRVSTWDALFLDLRVQEEPK